MPISKLYRIMLEKGMVAPEPCRPDYKVPNPDPNARCEFHMDFPGHSLGICPRLKHKIQDFIDAGKLLFNPVLPPKSIPTRYHTCFGIEAVG